MYIRKKKIILFSISIIVIIIFAYFGYGIKEYFEWIKIKQTVADGGFPWQCGVYEMTLVQEGCTRSCEGKCCCPLCDLLCDMSTQINFLGQENCKTNFACVAREVIPKGRPLITTRQAILAGTSNLITANGVVATQSVAANRTEKIIDWFNKVYIAFFE
ncbi:MAG: hypothetical protein ABH830_03840 [Patescibacteria group bacterium]